MRKTLQEQSLIHLELAHSRNPEHWLITFHLALILADIRDVPRSTYYAKKVIQSNPSFVNGWILLALLSSSNKAFKKAELACTSGIQECGISPK